MDQKALSIHHLCSDVLEIIVNFFEESSDLAHLATALNIRVFELCPDLRHLNPLLRSKLTSCAAVGCDVAVLRHILGREFSSDDLLRLCGVLNSTRKRGQPWNESSCAFAASCGYLSILQWLRLQGCAWFDDMMCVMSADSGRVDVLKYVIDEGVPWHRALYHVAARKDHVDVMSWAFEQGCPWNDAARRASMHSAGPRARGWVEIH